MALDKSMAFYLANLLPTLAIRKTWMYHCRMHVLCCFVNLAHFVQYNVEVRVLEASASNGRIGFWIWDNVKEIWVSVATDSRENSSLLIVQFNTKARVVEERTFEKNKENLQLRVKEPVARSEWVGATSPCGAYNQRMEALFKEGGSKWLTEVNYYSPRNEISTYNFFSSRDWRRCKKAKQSGKSPLCITRFNLMTSSRLLCWSISGYLGSFKYNIRMWVKGGYRGYSLTSLKETSFTAFDELHGTLSRTQSNVSVQHIRSLNQSHIPFRVLKVSWWNRSLLMRLSWVKFGLINPAHVAKR